MTSSDVDADAWEALGAPFVTVRSRTIPPEADIDLIDHAGAFGAWMRRYRTRLVVVRPDRFVAAGAAGPAGTAPPTPVRPTLHHPIDTEETTP